MPRHSQNQTDRLFFSRAELLRPGWGHFDERLQGDALLYFAQCPLSLKGCRTPVVTPEGFIYEKEYILKYLLKEKNKLADQRAKWELQNQRDKQKGVAKEKAVKEAELEKFHCTEMGVSVGDRHERGMEAPLSASELEFSHAMGKAQHCAPVVNKEASRAQSYWCSGVPGMAPAKDVGKPDMCPRCPMSNKKLRVKDLVALDLELSGKDVDGPGMFVCGVAKKPITHQQCYCLKPSGVVILETTYNEMVKGKDVCPVSGKKLGKGDVLKLKTGGTSYASHNEVHVDGFTEGNNFSRESSSRNLVGSCGGTGFFW